MRILLVEDNKRFSASLARSLEDEGYALDAAYDGIDGEGMGSSTAYDLIILDIMLPGKDGFAVCRALRAAKVATPIIILTARTDLEDRVRGLDGGADDYLPKPFELSELKARIRALLRRGAPGSAGELRVADLVLDPARHEVRRAGKELELRPREFALLEYLMRRPGQVVTRELVEEHLWNQEEIVVSNAVDVYVRRLRGKVDDLFEPKLLETVRGAGYRLRDPERVRG
ncbi:Transcriptional regulatory protein TcrA [bioreactor metagenome]|uniref:Transcriptional regulatory protein TcrA n=1 Tax=bioreactor metagenome TaxID=1076179 RepID=A0A645EJ28_9ZZZZ